MPLNKGSLSALQRITSLLRVRVGSSPAHYLRYPLGALKPSHSQSQRPSGHKKAFSSETARSVSATKGERRCADESEASGPLAVPPARSFSSFSSSAFREGSVSL